MLGAVGVVVKWPSKFSRLRCGTRVSTTEVPVKEGVRMGDM
jgi:hypothetical protein